MPDIFVAEPKTNNSTAPQGLNVFQQPISPSGNNNPTNDNAPITTNTVHLFSALKKYPSGISFKDQDAQETVLLFIRRSFITNIPWIIIGFTLLIIPLGLPFVLKAIPNPLPSLSSTYYLFFATFYYLLTIVYLFINYITWYFNISLVTDKRIIDINFSNLIYKDIAATKLSLVQDVSFVQTGAIRTLFNYGDVLVQTAGTLENFTFEACPQPENVVRIIENLIGRRREYLG